jgi:hypothetical protein
VVDIVPLYPPSLTPAFINDIRSFYIATYHDKFFSTPPAWFSAYILMELVYHVPVGVWAVGALIRGKFYFGKQCLQTKATRLTKCVKLFFKKTTLSSRYTFSSGLSSPSSPR